MGQEPFKRPPTDSQPWLISQHFHIGWQPLGNVDAKGEVSAAVSAVPSGEITGLRILGYIYSSIFNGLYPILSTAVRLMVTVPSD